jgi:hypothetical protein
LLLLVSRDRREPRSGARARASGRTLPRVSRRCRRSRSVRSRTYVRLMDRRRQGDLGELSAMYWLASKGLPVYLPVGHSPNCDLVTEAMGRPVRVQVKTSTRWCKSRWCVTLCTKGGNRSWNGVVKHLDPRLCEYLFVHVGDGRRWLLPTTISTVPTRCCSAAESTASSRSSAASRWPRHGPSRRVIT